MASLAGSAGVQRVAALAVGAALILVLASPVACSAGDVEADGACDASRSLYCEGGMPCVTSEWSGSGVCRATCDEDDDCEEGRTCLLLGDSGVAGGPNAGDERDYKGICMVAR